MVAHPKKRRALVTAVLSGPSGKVSPGAMMDIADVQTALANTMPDIGQVVLGAIGSARYGVRFVLSVQWERGPGIAIIVDRANSVGAILTAVQIFGSLEEVEEIIGHSTSDVDSVMSCRVLELAWGPVYLANWALHRLGHDVRPGGTGRSRWPDDSVDDDHGPPWDKPNADQSEAIGGRGADSHDS